MPCPTANAAGPVPIVPAPTIATMSLFGQAKHNRHSRRFTRRGLQAAQAEWQLIAAASNLCKLRQARLATA